MNSVLHPLVNFGRPRSPVLLAKELDPRLGQCEGGPLGVDVELTNEAKLARRRAAETVAMDEGDGGALIIV